MEAPEISLTLWHRNRWPRFTIVDHERMSPVFLKI